MKKENATTKVSKIFSNLYSYEIYLIRIKYNIISRVGSIKLLLDYQLRHRLQHIFDIPKINYMKNNLFLSKNESQAVVSRNMLHHCPYFEILD